jgi:outer membrane immunogenic protein
VKNSAIAILLIMSAGSTSAIAADLPVKTAPNRTVTDSSWTGFYIGGQVGWSRSSWNNAPFFATIGPFSAGVPIGSTSDNGVAGGIHAGYNYQVSNLILGIEADYKWLDANTNANYIITTGPGLTFNMKQSLDHYGTVRGRLGFVAPNPAAMFYVTGGWAFGTTKADIAGVGQLGGSFVTGASKNRSGWTAGAGVEYRISQHWLLGVEYRYVDLGDESIRFNFPLRAVTGSTDLTLNEVTARVSYKF